MIEVKFLHPRATWDHIGSLPHWLNPANPASASEQLHAAYGHGGGWQPFPGFTLEANDSITYPGDPAHRPIAEMHLRDERVLVYEYSWVAIIQPDRSFEICRMD